MTHIPLLLSSSHLTKDHESQFHYKLHLIKLFPHSWMHAEIQHTTLSSLSHPHETTTTTHNIPKFQIPNQLTCLYLTSMNLHQNSSNIRDSITETKSLRNSAISHSQTSHMKLKNNNFNPPFSHPMSFHASHKLSQQPTVLYLSKPSINTI
jgi:hypothetical protein